VNAMRNRWIAVPVSLALTAAFAAAAARKPKAPSAAPREPVYTLNKEIALCDYGGNKVCLVDKTGKITWQIAAQRPQDVWILPSGNILFTHVKGVKEVSLDKKVVWKYDTAKANEIHACQPLPDGKVMIAESGPMQIIEVDRAGTITKTVKLTTNCKNTHGQMRGARKTAAGTYLVGQYSDAVVREYDETGKIVREIKHKPAFGGLRLPNGNTLVATGDGHRIFEVDKAGQVVWEIKEKDLPGNPLRFVAGLRRLANGNTLVCNWGGHGHVGKQPQIFEVTRDKKVVGVLDDWKQFKTISGAFVRGPGRGATKFEIVR
jgi:outer membrane protein assembly factor BamB